GMTTDIKHPANVGMGHFSSELKFLNQTINRSIVVRTVRAYGFQSDALVQFGVDGLVNLAHAADTELPNNPVSPGYQLTGSESPEGRVQSWTSKESSSGIVTVQQIRDFGEQRGVVPARVCQELISFETGQLKGPFE